MMATSGANGAVARIDLAETADFDLGGLEVSPAGREVAMDGRRRELEPKVMQVLVALARARPGVLSRDRLIAQCWGGRIVGDDALNRCIVALRHLAREFSPEPFTIETVPRVGYRLIEREAASAPPRTRRLGLTSWRRLVAAAALLLVVAGSLLVWQQRALSAKPASIAVLPFRNLSSAEPWFAQGVGEEILGILSREPAFRVTGRNAAARFGEAADPREIGRAFDVDYVLEGSVRSDRGRVRVTASLIQTEDGVRLWSETYDRRLDDILAIQAAIGQAVARGLKRELVHLAADRVPAVNGEAYALYLNARGLLRTGNPQSGGEALRLLRQAVSADPEYAPAWASMAEAIQLEARSRGPDALIAAVPEAIAAARRALRLDPALAEAHAAMGTLLGDITGPGIAHTRRAAALDPRTADGMIWRFHAHEAAGQFDAALADMRRAHRLDPAWTLPVRGLVDTYAANGDRAAAEAIARQGFADDPLTRAFALARIAWLFGDVSEAARRWAAVAETSSRFAAPARRSLTDARLVLGLSGEPLPRSAQPGLVRSRFAPLWWMPAPPTPAMWREWNRSRVAQLVHLTDNLIAAKLMLRAGRAREIAATFDGPVGFQTIRAGQPLQPCQVVDVPILALALRAVGRDAEAAALLGRADALLRRLYARNALVPIWLEADAAALWAVQGRREAALDALERAARRGWTHLNPTDLRRLEDEPAFRPLHGHPRFEALRARLNAHFARERAETAKVLKTIA